MTATTSIDARLLTGLLALSLLVLVITILPL
jgi:hypothetical protein